MRMADLPITGITVSYPDEVEKSGPFRQRRTIIGMPYTVNISWKLTRQQYLYLDRFFILLSNGALYFDISLPSIQPIDDNECYEDYNATYVPNSFSKSVLDNHDYSYTAVLEVTPKEQPEATLIHAWLVSITNSFYEDDHNEWLINNFGTTNVTLEQLQSLGGLGDL